MKFVSDPEGKGMNCFSDTGGVDIFFRFQFSFFLLPNINYFTVNMLEFFPGCMLEGGGGCKYLSVAVRRGVAFVSHVQGGLIFFHIADQIFPTSTYLY